MGLGQKKLLKFWLPDKAATATVSLQCLRTVLVLQRATCQCDVLPGTGICCSQFMLMEGLAHEEWKRDGRDWEVLDGQTNSAPLAR